MDDGQHRMNRHGPAVMFALLLSLLLGGGSAAGFADTRPAGFKPAETGKALALGRSIRRASDEQPDPADLPLEPGYLPHSEAGLSQHRLPATGTSRPAIARAREARAPFHARAPPAA